MNLAEDGYEEADARTRTGDVLGAIQGRMGTVGDS
jgi:hypothetical protein